MTFLPIVDRELRIRARWRSTYIVRTGIAVVAIAVTVVMLVFTAFGARTIGSEMLLTLGWVTFGFCVIEGLRSTADAISEEKREGTLGLLFLTELRGYDVVLGKFAATSISSFCGLIAVLPTLALPALLGGVTGGELWRVVLALVNALFFSLCAGMLVSVLSRSEQRAWVATVLVVGVAVAGLPILASMTGNATVSTFSPTTPMTHAFEALYRSGPAAFWLSLGATNGLSWLCLLVASWLLPRTWQETGRPRRNTTPRKRGRDDRRRGELLAANPMWWLAIREHGQQRTLWIIVLVVCAGGTAIELLNLRNAVAGWGLFGFVVLVHLVITIWVATEACYSFADARSSGALELLLSTPLSIRQIVHGQQLALRDLFMKPVIFLIAVEAALLGVQVTVLAAAGTPGAAIAAVLIVVVFSMGWFILDLLAVSRVGMWFSLTSAKPTHALTRTILYVLVLPALLLPCVSILGPGLMVAKSVIFLTWAQSKLDNQFRAAATRRFDGTRPTHDPWTRNAPPPLRMPQ